MSSAGKQERIAGFERACRARGLAVTTQRRTIVETVLDRADHPTADQVYELARRRLPAISRTTVYRVLDDLVELGLITKICHPGSAARFDPKIQQHHHLVCVRCNAIIDIEDERLNSVAWPDVRGPGFEIRDYHIHFRGICARCRQECSADRRAAPSRKRSAISTTRRGPRKRALTRKRRIKK